jgi:hypothetical protein
MKLQTDYFEGDSMEYQKNDVIKKKEIIFQNFLVTFVCMLKLYSTKKLVIQEMAEIIKKLSGGLVGNENPGKRHFWALKPGNCEL